MPIAVLRIAQRRMALKINSVPLSLTIILGLPRSAMSPSSSRATRRPNSEVSATSVMLSRVQSSTTTDRMRKRRPSVRWSATKSKPQRSFGAGGISIGSADNPLASAAATHGDLLFAETLKLHSLWFSAWARASYSKTDKQQGATSGHFGRIAEEQRMRSLIVTFTGPMPVWIGRTGSCPWRALGWVPSCPP
jgi:hypothetical protein